MIECTNCGAQLRPSARICIKCGQAVNRDSLSTAETPTPISPSITPSSAGISQTESAATISANATTAAPVFDTPVTASINTQTTHVNQPTEVNEETIPFTTVFICTRLINTQIYLH